MSKRMKFLVTPVCLLGIAVPALIGCEDAEARQRSEAQRVILQASQEFRTVAKRPYVLNQEGETARLRSELNAVVNRLSQAPDGGPAQQAAKALLTAEALHELAGLDLAEIADLELRHRNERRVARGMLEQLVRIESLAAAREAVNTQEQRRTLQRDRDAAEAAVRAIAQRVQQLDGPITELTESNRRDADEVRRLREEANALIRRAVDLGYSEGFSSFEQGVARRREADRLEYGIAHREIELGLELEPQHEQATMQAEHMQRMIESIRGMLRTFDEMDQARAAEIARLRGEIDGSRAQVAEALRSINASAGGELKDFYDAAAERIERAARQAQQAASRLGSQNAQSPRLAEARSFELLGRLHADRARSIMDHALLLNAVVESGAVTNRQAHQVEAQSLLTTHAELIEKAQEAYANAEQALSQVTAPGAEAYRTNIQRVMASLSGETVDWSTPGMDDVPDFDLDDREGVEGLPGFDMGDVSAAQLLAMLDQMDFDAMLAMSGMGDQVPQEMRPMARQAFQRAINNIRPRVRSGEIATADQLLQALMMEMAQGMGGGVGGFPQ